MKYFRPSSTWSGEGIAPNSRTLDAFPAALYVIDVEGFISYFNPVCIDFAGVIP